MTTKDDSTSPSQSKVEPSDYMMSESVSDFDDFSLNEKDKGIASLPVIIEHDFLKHGGGLLGLKK